MTAQENLQDQLAESRRLAYGEPMVDHDFVDRSEGRFEPGRPNPGAEAAAARGLAPRPIHDYGAKFAAPLIELDRNGFIEFSDEQKQVLKAFEASRTNLGALRKRYAAARSASDALKKQSEAFAVKQMSAGTAWDKLKPFVPEPTDEPLTAEALKQAVELAKTAALSASQNVQYALSYESVWPALVIGFDENVAVLDSPEFSKRKLTRAQHTQAEERAEVALRDLRTANLAYIATEERGRKNQVLEIQESIGGIPNLDDVSEFTTGHRARIHIRSMSQDPDIADLDIELADEEAGDDSE